LAAQVPAGALFWQAAFPGAPRPPAQQALSQGASVRAVRLAARASGPVRGVQQVMQASGSQEQMRAGQLRAFPQGQGL